MSAYLFRVDNLETVCKVIARSRQSTIKIAAIFVMYLPKRARITATIKGEILAHYDILKRTVRNFL